MTESDVARAHPLRVWRPSRRGAKAAQRRVASDLRPVQAAVNIGPSLTEALARVGISDLDTLGQVGAPEAWKRIRRDLGHASEAWLYALEGAIRGVRSSALCERDRKELRRRAEAGAAAETWRAQSRVHRIPASKC